ncbi:DUF1398 domain-containing protein [Reyranella sp.]|uniref:DUF1398 domain-containing protein n=1 Tax=Reyranella sp. TaxID=1929291 RepID=UPI002730DD96|nr:DUF1398 family protein [Reyranella sp.]MDP2374071.1 DUF1398 family protein [Reyranella sp.]
MNANLQAIVEACSRGSEEDSLNFRQVLGMLADAGVESYYADFRRSAKTYYLPDGESIEVQANDPDVAIASAFDVGHVEAAVRQSQAGTHTYRSFCEKVMAAGCSGYLVSLLGRRVVYFGRTAETHVEHFPNK